MALPLIPLAATAARGVLTLGRGTGGLLGGLARGAGRGARSLGRGALRVGKYGAVAGLGGAFFGGGGGGGQTGGGGATSSTAGVAGQTGRTGFGSVAGFGAAAAAFDATIPALKTPQRASANQRATLDTLSDQIADLSRIAFHIANVMRNEQQQLIKSTKDQERAMMEATLEGQRLAGDNIVPANDNLASLSGQMNQLAARIGGLQINSSSVLDGLVASLAGLYLAYQLLSGEDGDGTPVSPARQTGTNLQVASGTAAFLSRNQPRRDAAGRYRDRAGRFAKKPSLASRALRFAGKGFLPLTIGLALYDAYQGATADPDASFSDAALNAASSITNGLTFGLLGSSADEIAANADAVRVERETQERVAEAGQQRQTTQTAPTPPPITATRTMDTSGQAGAGTATSGMAITAASTASQPQPQALTGTGRQPIQPSPFPTNKPHAQGMGDVPDPTYRSMGQIADLLYFGARAEAMAA